MSATLSPPSETPTRAQDLVTSKHWILVFLLLGSTVINFLDRQTVSILAPTIKAEFQMSNAAYGWVITAFQLSYLIMYSVGGRLADVFGVRRAMIYFVSWWSIACVGQGLIVGPKSLALARSLLAVGEGGNWPAAVKAVAEQVPGSLKSLAVGIVNSGSSLGAIIAAPLVTGIALTLGWRAAFVICGLLGLVWLPLWIWQTRGYQAGGPKAAEKPVSASWGAIFGYRRSWAIFLGRFLGDQVWFFWVLWLPLYLSEARGQDLAGIGRVAWIPFAGAALGNYAGGGVSSWLISRGFSTVTTRRLVMGLAAAGSSVGKFCAVTRKTVYRISKDFISSSLRHSTFDIRYSTFCLSSLFLFFFLTCLAQPASGRILYVNSYHAGYGSSDEITRGIQASLAGSGVELKILLMDTKRRMSEPEIQEKVKEALDVIDDYRPNVVIVSDDAAAKYLVAPHLNNGPLPVVFCGVNWSAEQYGFPTAWVTGMLEVVPVFETIEVVRKQYPAARRMCFLTEDSLSERNNQRLLDPQFKERGLAVTYALVRDFASWKAAFLEASGKDDFIYLSTNGAIQDWNDEEARAFVLQNIRKPVVACDDFMMPFAAFGLVKVAREQGEWAASTALVVLGGEKPGDIPITRNQRTKAYVNPRLAAKIGFPSDSRLLQQCEKVN